MIENTKEYLELRQKLFIKIKSSSLSKLMDFESLFNDAFVDRYPNFERTYDPSKGEKIDYLFKIVKNQMMSLLKKANGNKISINENIDYGNSMETSEYKDSDFNIAEFRKRVIVNRGFSSENDLTQESRSSIGKYFNSHIPLIRLALWSVEEPVTNEVIEQVTERVGVNFKSESYFEWRFKLPIIRLRTWIRVDDK